MACRRGTGVFGGVLAPFDRGAGLGEDYLVRHLGGALRLAQQFFGPGFHGEIGFVWKFLVCVAVEDLELGLGGLEPFLDCLVVF